MPLNPNIIGAATDNIADWSNDSATRLDTLINSSLSVQATLNLLNANVNETIRIAEQVAIIREEIQNPTG